MSPSVATITVADFRGARHVLRSAIPLLIAIAFFNAVSGSPVLAQSNQAQAGIAGLNNGTVVNGDGSGDAALTLGTVTLSLVKQARDLAGNVLAPAADVTSGQTLYFVLHVDNTTGWVAADVQLTDLLNEAQFSFVPASLEYATVASGSGDAAIWAATWTALTDAVGAPDDVASMVDTGGAAEADRLTVGGVAGQENQTLDVAPNTLWALRFRVTVD